MLCTAKAPASIPLVFSRSASRGMTDQAIAETPAVIAPINVLLGKPTVLARVVAFTGSVDTRVLGNRVNDMMANKIPESEN